MPFIHAIADYLHEHWIKFVTAALLMAAGWVIGRRRARRDWQRKEFFDRLNFSLNVFTGGKLLVRTLIEKDCRDVFLNQVAAETIVNAARKTSEADPILPLPRDDYWYYLNAVLNELAEKFAVGQMKQDFGLPVDCRTYLICLTSECAGDLRTRKVRAMVVQKRILEKLPEEQPQFESPHHITRWDTLQKLSAAWKKEPHRFLEMEICL